MAAVRRWIGTVLRQWRKARYERKQVLRWQEDRRSAEHLERARAGIKDNPPPSR